MASVQPMNQSLSLVLPWENARIRSWSAVVEQVFQLGASSRIWDGPMKWIPLQPLPVKGTWTSVRVQLELSPSNCFATHCSLPRNWRSWGTKEEEPSLGESNCWSVQVRKSLFLEIVAYNLTCQSDKLARNWWTTRDVMKNVRTLASWLPTYSAFEHEDQVMKLKWSKKLTKCPSGI